MRRATAFLRSGTVSKPSRLAADRDHPAVVHRLHLHPRERRVAPDRFPVGEQERPTAVVEQPLGFDPGLHHAIGDTVGLEMVGLRVVHGDQERGTDRLWDGRTETENAGTDRQPNRAADRPYELSPSHDFGIAPLARSSSRRASGTTALAGYARIRCSSCAIAAAVCCWRNSNRAHSSSAAGAAARSEEHTSELQSPCNLVCRLLLEKKKKKENKNHVISHSSPTDVYTHQLLT